MTTIPEPIIKWLPQPGTLHVQSGGPASLLIGGLKVGQYRFLQRGTKGEFIYEVKFLPLESVDLAVSEKNAVDYLEGTANRWWKMIHGIDIPEE